jgi:hypothetical protein
MLYVRLRDQLEVLFAEEYLPTHLTVDAYRWGIFISLFTEVIEECPLELSKEGIHLKHVEGVTVTKLRDLPLRGCQRKHSFIWNEMDDSSREQKRSGRMEHSCGHPY